MEEDVSCAVFAVIGVEWDGRAELGRVLTPGWDLPLVFVLLLCSLAGGKAGFGRWSGSVLGADGVRQTRGVPGQAVAAASALSFVAAIGSLGAVRFEFVPYTRLGV